jgi:hypothetical protein
MAEEKTTSVPSFLEDVPTRFEGGASVMGVPLPKIVTEPFKNRQEETAPDFLEDARPSAGSRIKEAAIGAAQGAARDAPVAAGMAMGLRMGLPMAAAAAPVIGPIAGAIPLITTAIGGGAGYFAGSELDRWFPAVSRDDLIPYREGGKTFGSTLGTAPILLGVPVMTGNRVSRFMSGLGEMARRNPATFMATEGLTGVSMGLAGGASESYFPGEAGTRFGAELTAGLFTPSKLLLTGVDLAAQGLKTARETIAGREGRQELRAANIMLDILQQSGEDPERLVRALRQKLPKGIAPTSAQKTGSSVLMDLETSLGQQHAQFGGQTAKQGREAMEAYELLIENLQKVGTPESLRTAAQLRENKFQALLEGRLAQADLQSAQRISRITRDTPAARGQIGEIIKSETETALTQARTAERQLWTAAMAEMTRPVTERVQRTVDVDWDHRRNRPITRSFIEERLVAPTLRPSLTAQTFMRRASEVGDLVYDDVIPSMVRRIMDGFGLDQAAVQRYKTGRNTQEYLETGKVPDSFMPRAREIPLSELISYRSNLLDEARKDPANAEIYAKLAHSLIQDLSTVSTPYFDQARAFSKALNDSFTRTFAKTASESGDLLRTGAERLPAEILVARAFGSNADVTMQRMLQGEEAVKFMRGQYDDAVAKFGAESPQAAAFKPMANLSDRGIVSIQDAQNRVLRLLAADSIETVFDKTKNTYVQRLNTAKLTRFTKENETMLRKLGIIDDLANATHAQNLLFQVKAQNNVMENTLRDQTAFAKVLSSENPTLVLGDVLNSRNPVRGFTQLTKLAKAGGPDAVNGLKSAVLDYAYTKAGGMSGKFSVQAYKDALFEPIARNQPSIANILRASGAMSLTEVKNTLRLIQPMARVEMAMKNGIPIDNVIEGADAVTDLALRAAGSNLGSVVAPQGPGSLIVASAGSKAVRKIFDELPNATVRQILENASRDPEMMAILLEKGRTPKQQIDIYNRLLNKLGSMGVSVGKTTSTPALNYLAPEEPRRQTVQELSSPLLTPEGQAARQLRLLPPAPSTRGVPGIGKQSNAAPQGGGGGAPSTESRAMFQQLFPFDSIGAMAAQPPQPPQQPAPG